MSGILFHAGSGSASSKLALKAASLAGITAAADPLDLINNLTYNPAPTPAPDTSSVAVTITDPIYDEYNRKIGYQAQLDITITSPGSIPRTLTLFTPDPRLTPTIELISLGLEDAIPNPDQNKVIIPGGDGNYTVQMKFVLDYDNIPHLTFPKPFIILAAAFSADLYALEQQVFFTPAIEMDMSALALPPGKYTRGGLSQQYANSDLGWTAGMTVYYYEIT